MGQRDRLLADESAGQVPFRAWHVTVKRYADLLSLEFGDIAYNPDGGKHSRHCRRDSCGGLLQYDIALS